MHFRRLFRLPWRNPARIRREVDDELRFHLEMRAAEIAEGEGLADDAARAEAARRFGDLEYTRAYCGAMDARKDRSDRRAEMLHELRQDAAYALRQLRRSPAFTAVAVLTLGLGIGANTAIYSVVNGVLLRPLPYREPARLVRVLSTLDDKPNSVSPADFADWRAQARSFDGLAAISTGTENLTGGSAEPERLETARVTANFFGVLGVAPLTGRAFAPGEDAASAAPVVVLGERLWRRRFAADPGLVGRTIALGGVPHTVVGVMPRAATYPAGVELWLPLVMQPAWLSDASRGARWLRVVGRVGPAGVAASAAEMREIARRLEALHPDRNTGFSVRVPPLQAYMTGDVRRPLLVLMGGVGFVALIACANVAALLLVRGAARAREMAVRSALGAGRGRLVRQLVTESLVLGLLGGALGLALAVWGTRAFVAFAPSDIPRLDEVAVNGRALAVTGLAALVAGLLFGLLPALHASAAGGGSAVAGSLRDGGRGGADRGGSRARSALVVAEVALAVALLAGAGLLARSFAELLRVDVGLRTEGVTTFSVSLPDAAYPTEAAGRTFTRSLLERVEAIPGVRAAGAISGLPLTGSYFFLSFEVDGRAAPPPGQEASAVVRFTTPGYFAAVGLPLVRGRAFTERDREGAPTVFLINREAARRYFPGEDPLGKRIAMGWRASNGSRMAGEIVGVVGDVKQFGLGGEPTADVYAPADQWPWSDLTVVMRAERGAPVAAAARAAVRAVDPNLPVFGLRALDEVVSESVARPRFYMTLLGAFALMAVALAGVGIYGVLSYAVGRRVREIGLRVALGATRARVLRMVVGQGLALAAVGAALGVAGALWLARAMATLLFGVTPGDPVTFVGVVVLFLGVAALACLVPALRAARVDPAVALRAD